MRIKLIFLAVCCSISLFAFQQLHSAINAIQKLGISEELARECIITNFTSSGWGISDKQDFKKVAAGDRAALVRELGQYAKAYTKTEAFRKAYLEYRERIKPTQPEAMDSVDVMKAKHKAELTKSIQEAEKNMASLPADIRETMKGVLDQMRTQLKEIDNPDNPMYSKEMAGNISQMQQQQTEQHKADVDQWEKDNPVSPDRMILGKLEAFMADTENIDFKAKLIPGYGGKMKFADASYEEMSEIRKMCFRAGKDAVDSVRAFTQEWITELKASNR